VAYTMREVAERAGVSPATVSRVLNKTHYISPETAQRVLEVVNLLQYHKNVHARRLSTGQSNLLGLVISEITNPYFPELIKGFQAAAWDRGFDVLLCNTEYGQERAKSVIKKLIESDVAGVAVMTGSVDRDMTGDLTAAGIGIVFSDLGPSGTMVSNVSINYEKGILEAIRHVAELGHQRAAIIAGAEENRTAVMIRQTLEAGLRERQIDTFPVTHCDSHLDAGASAVRMILASPKVPTVIFCGSDRIAMGAMSALEEAGAKIPEDVSVVGIDDVSFAFLTRPPLTTIRVPREELGRTAFQALDKMLRLKRRKGAEYHLDTELIVRKSTAPARWRPESEVC
jgi:DNA-binding LacI/PurR family transcriptional regulator